MVTHNKGKQHCVKIHQTGTMLSLAKKQQYGEKYFINPRIYLGKNSGKSRPYRNIRLATPSASIILLHMTTKNIFSFLNTFSAYSQKFDAFLKNVRKLC